MRRLIEGIERQRIQGETPDVSETPGTFPIDHANQ